LTKRIVAAVRKGVFLRAAASAGPIAYSTLTHWLADGQRPDGRPVYKQFRQRITTAQAAALGRAEAEVYRTDPKFWLTHGVFRRRWHPFKGEIDFRGQMQIEPMGVAACPAPVEHLAEAYKILQSMGHFPRNEAEGQRLLETAGMADTLDVPQDATEAPPAVDLPSTAGIPLLPSERERRPPASLRRAKAAAKAAKQEGEIRVAHRNNGNGKPKRRT
jgi:hypothetical protein